MSVTFADDATAVDHLIQELTRPVGQRRASADQVSRAVLARGNRRRGARVNLVASDVSVRLGGETVSAVDFSMRGIQFRCATRVVPGSTVMLSLQWRQDNPSIALGRVMWAAFEKSNASADPHYRVGVIFETADVRIIKNMMQQCGFGQMNSNGVELVSHRG